MKNQRVKILVVEDEEGVRRHLVRALRKEGCIVEEAADGEEAAEKFRQTLHPAVLLDLRMPKCGGIDVLRIIQRVSPATKVVILTGHGDKDDAIQALNLHAFRYLEKPPNIEDVVRALDEAIDGYAEDIGFSPASPAEPIPSLDDVHRATAGLSSYDSEEEE